MFSEELNNNLKSLGIDTNRSVTHIRNSIEDLLDNSAKLINTEHNDKYLAARDLYSTFMEEYNTILDAQ